MRAQLPAGYTLAICRADGDVRKTGHLRRPSGPHFHREFESRFDFVIVLRARRVARREARSIRRRPAFTRQVR